MSIKHIIEEQKKAKYLDNKLGLINAMISGHCIGIVYVAKMYGEDYHYDKGEKLREYIEKEVRNIFNYGRKFSKKQSQTQLLKAVVEMIDEMEAPEYDSGIGYDLEALDEGYFQALSDIKQNLLSIMKDLQT